MKRLVLAVLGLGGLAVILVSVDLLAILNSDSVLGRYPGAMLVVSERFNLLSVYQGYVSQEGVYQIDGDVMSVWRWYARQFGVTPENGPGAEGLCMGLTKTTQYFFFRHTAKVLLCPGARGTLVRFKRSVYLGR